MSGNIDIALAARRQQQAQAEQALAQQARLAAATAQPPAAQAAGPGRYIGPPLGLPGMGRAPLPVVEQPALGAAPSAEQDWWTQSGKAMQASAAARQQQLAALPAGGLPVRVINWSALTDILGSAAFQKGVGVAIGGQPAEGLLGMGLAGLRMAPGVGAVVGILENVAGGIQQAQVNLARQIKAQGDIVAARLAPGPFAAEQIQLAQTRARIAYNEGLPVFGWLNELAAKNRQTGAAQEAELQKMQILRQQALAVGGFSPFGAAAGALMNVRQIQAQLEEAQRYGGKIAGFLHFQTQKGFIEQMFAARERAQKMGREAGDFDPEKFIRDWITEKAPAPDWFVFGEKAEQMNRDRQEMLKLGREILKMLKKNPGDQFFDQLLSLRAADLVDLPAEERRQRPVRGQQLGPAPLFQLQ
jgi:hypothetical protein